MSDIQLSTEGHPAYEASGPYEVPPFWTPEHVAHRLIHAFEVLLAVGGGVGPRSCGATWPVAIREFADLLEDDRDAARDSFVAALNRPTASEIDQSDEALAWPLRYMADEPMAADAVLLWSFCKAGGFSITAALRARTERAKRMAARMQEEENQRIQRERKLAIVEAGRWRDEKAKEMGLASMPEPERHERWQELTEGMRSRIAADHERLKPVVFLPWQAVPEKILSRTSLDRYLPAGLAFLAEQLHDARVPVR